MLYTVASDSNPSVFWHLKPPHTYAIDAAPVKRESAQELLAKAAWQRLSPLDPADNRPGHLARLFTTKGPPADARQVTVPTGDGGPGTLQGLSTPIEFSREVPDEKSLVGRVSVISRRVDRGSCFRRSAATPWRGRGWWGDRRSGAEAFRNEVGVLARPPISSASSIARLR